MTPAVMQVMAERSFDAAGDLLTSQLLLARAEARARGTPVEVVYDERRRQVRCRWLAAGRRALETAGATGAPALEVDWPGDEEHDDRIAEPWAVRALPGDVRIVARRPEPPDEEPLGTAPRAVEPAAGPLRIAVYLPDGSTLLGRPRWLVDDGGRTARLEVNVLSGVPRLVREEDEAEVAPGEEAARERSDEERLP